MRIANAGPAREAQFAAWMKGVNARVEKMIGVAVADLPDMPFAEWFEEGMGPGRAAAKVIKAAMVAEV